jgi:predicted phosphoribosyltransferase
MTFRDRNEAGRLLARRLAHLAHEHPLVVAVVPGGVPVAIEIADALGAELDVRAACELVELRGVERSAGAVAEGVEGAIGPDAAELQLVSEALERLVRLRREEAERRGRCCRGGRPPAQARGRVTIVVADGVDGGLAPLAVLRAVRAESPARLVLAAPVVDSARAASLRGEADELVFLDQPPDFIAVGYWYLDPDRPSDEAIAAMLARRSPGSASEPSRWSG